MKNTINLLLIINLIFNIRGVFAQNSKIDSLIKLSETEINSGEKARIMNDISSSLYAVEPKKSWEFAKKAEKISNQCGDIKQLSRAYLNFGIFYWASSQLDSAIVEFGKAQKIFDGMSYSEDNEVKTSGLKGLSSVFNNIGLIYYSNGELAKSLTYFVKSKDIKFKLSQSADGVLAAQAMMQLIASYVNIGSIFDELGNYNKALENYFKAKSLAEKTKNNVDLTRVHENEKNLCSIYDNIGVIYHRTKQYVEAEEYYNKAATVASSINEKGTLANILGNLSVVYLDAEKFNEAHKTLLKSIIIKKEINNISGLGSDYVKMGDYYLTLMNMEGIAKDSIELYKEHAKTNFKSANKIGNDINDPSLRISSLYGLANIELLNNNYNNVIELANSGIYYSQQMGAQEKLSKGYSILSKAYELSKEYQNAFVNYKLFQQTKDSIFNSEKSKEFGKLEATYEIEKKQAEEEQKLKEESRKLKEATERRDNIQYSIIFIAILAVFGTILSLGFIKISPKFAEGLIFFAFLIFFEFCLVLLDPYVDSYSGGEPAYKLLFNAILAGFIFPMHAFFESALKKRLINVQENRK